MCNVTEKIHEGLESLGIKPGDTVLMHSSYKSLGGFEGGAKAFFDAFISYLGNEGTLVLPALSFVSVTRNNPKFNLKQTPSCIGYLAEYFRTEVEGVVRSMHATHSCCAIGKNAEALVGEHYLDSTPVGKNSPFTKLPEFDGKILFLGCSLDRNTSMHGVEELVEPPYLLDRENELTYELDDGDGNVRLCKSVRHYFIKPDGSHYGQKYSKIADLLTGDEIKHGCVLAAACTVLDAKAVWTRGVEMLKKDPFYFVT